MRVAIITGATRGIGRGLLHKLAARHGKSGFGVATVYHGDEKAAADLRDECAGAGIDLLAERLDVGRLEGIGDFVGRVHARFGRIDYLVNNAAVDIFKTIEATSLDEWKRAQDVMLNAPFVFCKAVLPHMRKARFGRIVNMGASSKDYMKGAAGLGPFAIHKAALTVLTKTLALEEIAGGITVNMVAPGSTAGAGTNTEEKRIPVSSIPIGRRVAVDEVVEAIMYFLSDGAGATTGQFIGVNGGLST